LISQTFERVNCHINSRKKFQKKKEGKEEKVMNKFIITLLDKANLNQLSGKNAEDLAGNMYGTLLTLAQLVGVAVLIFGGIQLSLAFNEQDSDKKIKSFGVIIAGILLLTLKMIINKIVPGLIS